MIRNVLASLFFGLTLFAPLVSYAHNTGVSFQTENNGHTIDIGYDPASPVAGDKLLLDLRMMDPKTSEPVDFGDVWVRVEMNGNLLLATGVARSAYGPTTLLFQLPPDAHGKLTISARFEKGEKALAEGSFDVPVSSPIDRTRLAEGVIVLLIGMTIGAFMLGILREKRMVSLVYERLGSFFKL